ncbi:MAG: ATP-binding protein, partial [Candidatus Rokuibacteriota bacterium]
VHVDRDMWEKIVFNLVSNAFKFTFTGEIAVVLRPAGEQVELVIRDTGIGIAADEVPHVFERFHRVKGARGRTHEGTGIGLALVQELVKLHAGSVSVTSEVARGTTFTVAVPVGTAHLPADRIGAPRTLASAAVGAAPYLARHEGAWLPDDVAVEAAPPSSAPLSTQGARVLLADDNADMRDYLRRLLGQYWTVDAVADGQAALDAARRQRPDLVLTDVMMPRLDGFALLRALRADPETADVPVILLSARAGEESRVEGLEAGADDYLVKPFSAREVVARVHAHLELHRVREEAMVREKAARAEAEHANRAKDEFLAILGHELRNPLAAISSAIRVMTLTRPDDGTQQPRDIIARQARTLSRLVDDLLDVARLAAGKVVLRPTVVDLRDVAQRAVAALAPGAGAREHEVTLAAESVLVEGDPTRLEQVVSNLVDNAVKYTPAGGEIRVTVGPQDDEAVLTVEDTGVGMAPEIVPRIFDVFVQGERSLAPAQGGLGLGLTVVKRLVGLHGGRVDAESPGAGRGSVFTVRLPRLRQHAQALPIGSEPRPTPPRRVVVVEDNPDVRDALRMVLEMAGHRVDLATEGRRGVDMILALRPDVALVDVGLPGL